MCLKEQGADDIVSSSNHTLCFSILLGSVGTSETEINTMLFEKCMREMVIKFPTIVTLHRFNRSLKLCVNIGMGIF